MSDSLRPHEPQHARPPCPSPTPRVHPRKVKWKWSRSVVSDSLRPHEPQHTRPPCPSPLLESSQTHFHWVGDVIQPSYPLSSPSLPALNLSQHQSLFQWVWLFVSGGQSIGASASAPVLLMNIQGWFPLGLTSVISLLSKGLSRVFSNTTIQKNGLYGTQSSLWSSFHNSTWLLEKS